MKKTVRRILSLSVLSALSLTLSACGGDFSDYDDSIFDFPDKAAPAVPNPIPYEPEPEPESNPEPEPAKTKPEPAPVKQEVQKEKPVETKSENQADESRPKGRRRSDAPLESRPRPPRPVSKDTLKDQPLSDSLQEKIQSRTKEISDEDVSEYSEGPGRARPRGMPPPPKNVGMRDPNTAYGRRPNRNADGEGFRPLHRHKFENRSRPMGGDGEGVPRPARRRGGGLNGAKDGS